MLRSRDDSRQPPRNSPLNPLSTSGRMPDAMPNQFRVFKGENNRWKVEDLHGGEASYGKEFATKDEAVDAFRKHLAAEGLEMSVLPHRDGSSTVVSRPRFGQSDADLTLRLSTMPEVRALLDELCAELDMPPVETIIQALVMLKITVDAGKEGKRLAITDDDLNVEREILIPGRSHDDA
jgi:hypothetical protein